MKAYIAFNRHYGTDEGAALVFANTAREAKKVVYPVMEGCIWHEWTDLGVRWLNSADREHLFESEGDAALLAMGAAHVIDNPTVCSACEQWGPQIMANGMCDKCSRDYCDYLKRMERQEVIT